jgi:hypothetical protein
MSAEADEIQLVSNQQPGKATLKKWVQEAAGWLKKSDGLLLIMVNGFLS